MRTNTSALGLLTLAVLMCVQQTACKLGEVQEKGSFELHKEHLSDDEFLEFKDQNSEIEQSLTSVR